MTHLPDSGRPSPSAPDPTDAEQGPQPRRPAQTVDGGWVLGAEAQFAAEVSRLPARLGIDAELNGFAAWRVYAGVRAIWRVWRRAVSSISGLTKPGDTEAASYPGEEVFPAQHPIRHVFVECPGARRLAVVFSGFELANRPKYNYINRFAELACHRLHVLDDMGTRGSYYLGRDRDFVLARDIARLVDERLAQVGLTRADVVCVGSSKGGTAAIYHALEFGYGMAMAAAPQTYLAKYLRGTVQARDVSSLIAGGDGPEDHAFLDAFLFDLVAATPHRPRLQFFISPDDDHYQDHLEPFIAALDAHGHQHEVVLGEYQGHSAVGGPFSAHVLATLGHRRSLAVRQAPSRARDVLRRVVGRGSAGRGSLP